MVATDVDAAIMRVLEAEQHARREIQKCEAQSRSIRLAGTARAHAIAEQAARRVARVHAWTDAQIASRIAALDTQRAELDAGGTPIHQHDRLSAAVATLVDELIYATR
jgi:hypothetical protein